MANIDFVADETELQHICNEINTYTEFLSQIMVNYGKTIIYINQNAIVDDKITRKLLMMKEAIDNLRNSLEEYCKQYKTEIMAFRNEVAEKDNFLL